MRNFLTLLVLSLTLFGTGCKTSDVWAEGAEVFKKAGTELAAEIVPVVAESAARHGAEAAATIVANQVAKDDALSAEEKDDITKTMYGGGAATLASLLAALRMWALLRAKKAALGVVVKAVDRLPEEIGDQVKDMVGSLGGSAPAIKKTITAAKS